MSNTIKLIRATKNLAASVAAFFLVWNAFQAIFQWAVDVHWGFWWLRTVAIIALGFFFVLLDEEEKKREWPH